MIAPLDTALHEQICAASGSASTPTAAPPPAGARMRARLGRQRTADQRAQRVVLGRVADEHAAEQRLAVVGDHELLVRPGDRVVDGDFQRALGLRVRVAEADATSTPISFSFVDVSGSGNVPAPPASCAATISAIA